MENEIEKEPTCNIECLALPHLTEAAFAQDIDDIQVMTRKFPSVFSPTLITLRHRRRRRRHQFKVKCTKRIFQLK